MKTKRGRAEVKEVMLYFVFVSALLQFLTGGEGQDIYHVLTHPIHQGHVTLPWFFVQEKSVSKTTIGWWRKPTDTIALLLIPITVYATSSGQTQIFMPQNIHEICEREKRKRHFFRVVS